VLFPPQHVVILETLFSLPW